MTINAINIGAVANDGTGDPIRSAFSTVNENFEFINRGLYAGIEQSIISAVSVTSGYIFSNSWINADVIVGNTLSSSNGAVITGNVIINGNLTVTGAQAASQSQTASGSILNIQYSATPLSFNNSKDIGLEWQYYTTGPEKKAFLGWQNTTSSLVYMDNITESAGNIITAGSFGNVKFGQLSLGNTTAATSNTTGALTVAGGISTQGNLYVLGNIVANRANVGNVTFAWHEGVLNFGGSDTIYINGSPVQTAAQSFNGGTIGLATQFLSTTPSTSTTSGAVTIAGGLGVAGNVHTGNIIMNLPGLYYGNIGTNAQPFITSLGTLTSLNVGGQLTSQTIIPVTDSAFNLGGVSNRYNNIFGFNLNLTGTLTGATVNSTGGTHSGVLNLTSATKAINSTTGALVLTGSAGIGGNLYINGDNGNSLIVTSSIIPTTNAGASLGISTRYFNNIYGRTGFFDKLEIGGNVELSGNVVPEANATFSLGSITSWWNLVYGRSVHAQYADLAEVYLADGNYEPGTVVVFGGDKEITVTDKTGDHRVAGVISTNPAYLMNSSSAGLPVALRGRVPVKVVGPVEKGDLLVTSDVPGCAMSVGGNTGHSIKIFAKSLELNPDSGLKIIEAVII